MSKHKHHIIPRYRCKELGIDPDFDENIVEVDRLDHARIHWGYKCDDLEPLFEYITPAQWIIDLIPRGDNRDVGAAVFNARGEIDGIDISGENNSNWKGGITYDRKEYSKEYLKEYRLEKKEEIRAQSKEWYIRNREEILAQKKEYYLKKKEEIRAQRKEYYKTPEYRENHRLWKQAWRARKKAETQGEGTLKAFLK